MESQATRYSRQVSRAQVGREVVPQPQPLPSQGEGHDGSISDSTLSFGLTEGRRKRRSSIGDKVASLVGLSRNKSSSGSTSYIPPNGELNYDDGIHRILFNSNVAPFLLFSVTASMILYRIIIASIH